MAITCHAKNDFLKGTDMTQWQFGTRYEIDEHIDKLVIKYEGVASFVVNHHSKQTLHPKYIKFRPIIILDRSIGYRQPDDAHINGESAIIMPIDKQATKKIYEFIQRWIDTRNKDLNKKESK